MIRQAVRVTKDLVDQKMGENPSSSSPTIPHNSSSLYQQFRTAASALQKQNLNSILPLTTQYQNLKEMYKSIGNQIRKYKEQRAGIVGNPDTLKELLSSRANPSPVLSRVDLHHLVESNHLIDDIERQSDKLYRQLHQNTIPQLTKSVSTVQHWEQAEKFVLSLPQMTSDWTTWVADESRLVRAIREAKRAFSSQFFLHAQMHHFQVRYDLDAIEETHLLGADHIMGSMRKCLQDNLANLQDTWKKSEPAIRDLFALLKQIQTSLSDQPTRLAQDMSNQLLLEQSKFVQYVQLMDVFHQEWMMAAIWSTSQCFLDALLQVIALMNLSQESSLLHLLRLYDDQVQQCELIHH